MPPGPFGGNMDTRHLTKGSILHLPVQHAGALFSCGDAHAAQGDGEVCVTGIESPVYAALRFDLIKGRSIPAPQFQTPGPLTPLVDEAGWYATMGVNEDLMQAAKDSLRAMVEHISTTYGLEPVEAYVLASLVVDLKISEIVDQPNWIVSSYLPLAIFGLLSAVHFPRNVCRNVWETVVRYSGIVTEGTKEQDREAGGMNVRVAAWIAWSLAALSVAMFVAGGVLYVLARSAQSPGEWVTIGTVSEMLTFVPYLAFPIIGALVASRRPENPIGWICLASGLLFMLLAVTDSYSIYGTASPGSVPFPVAVGTIGNQWLWVPTVGLLGIFLILLFPDGKVAPYPAGCAPVLGDRLGLNPETLP